MRARISYDGAALEALLSNKGWTNTAAAKASGVSQEHISDIIDGTTKTCRRDTQRKLVSGLMSLGATEAEAKTIFISS